MTQDEINNILAAHKAWLIGETGARANLRDANLRGAGLSYAGLSDANLRGADLSDANLRGADLSDADLSDANLRGANLRGADLSDADLSDANLRGADLSYADLRGAVLSYAGLSGANLRGADLSGAKYNPCTLFLPLQCPEEGSFIAFKKASGFIVKLEIPSDAKRSSATSRKCRASKAKVIAIETLDGNPASVESVRSNYDPDFVYHVGSTVEVPNFDNDRWHECAPGIHFFLTRGEAQRY